MEAKCPFHTTINFYRKHDFRTEKTVLFTVTILTHIHTHTHTQTNKVIKHTV